MFTKILVANRGEIAISAFRAGHGLGVNTVAVFLYEDCNSIHRQKADEAYKIGEEGHPTGTYLNVEEAIRVDKESGAAAILPGAMVSCPRRWISPEPLRGPGSSSSARWARRFNGRETCGSFACCLCHGAPRAAHLGRQRRRRIPESVGGWDRIPGLRQGCCRGRPWDSSRRHPRPAGRVAIRCDVRSRKRLGDDTMFAEQAFLRPRHIEVQILANE